MSSALTVVKPKTSSLKTALQNAAVAIVATIISLAGIEICLRVWGPEVLALGDIYVFYRYDPVLGWDNLPNAHGYLTRAEYRTEVSNNSLGMRDVEIGEKQPDEYRVAFLGDSFTWGVGVSYGERFTEIAEKLDPNIRSLNFGVSGFSPVQYLLQLGRVFALKPDYVVLVFCLGNDLTDNVEYRPYDHPKPYAKLSSDGTRVEIAGYPLPVSEQGPSLLGANSSLRTVGLIKRALDSWTKPRGGKVGLYAESLRSLYLPTHIATPAEREMIASLYKINELLIETIRNKVDAEIGPNRFALALAPTQFEYLPATHDFDPNAVHDGVLASLRRLNIPVIDGQPVITPGDFWERDGHWRPSGHRKFGEMIAKYLAAVPNHAAAAARHP
jgi:lysophospholipase L1-like esterase